MGGIGIFSRLGDCAVGDSSVKRAGLCLTDKALSIKNFKLAKIFCGSPGTASASSNHCETAQRCLVHRPLILSKEEIPSQDGHSVIPS
jgi:hypothetical protein